MLHTIQEAMQLTGLTRKSLYNHMGSGRVSYTSGTDGRRYFETSELERAYGKLKVVTHLDSPGIIQPYTPPADGGGALAKLIEDAVQRATAPLVKEIAELKETLMRIEHKPDIPAPAAPQPVTPAVSDQASVSGRKGQSADSPSISSFADLLSSFD